MLTEDLDAFALEARIVVTERELICQLNYGTETVMANVVISQSDDCSVIATITPHQQISLISSNVDCFIESIRNGLSSLLLKTTPVTISEQNNQLKAKLGVAELELQNLPQDSDTVSVRMYLTNLHSYFYKNHIKFDINIPGQPQVVLSAHEEGAISNIAEVFQIPYSDLEKIKKLVDSICWLCSFASGRLSAVARMEVLRNKELIYQELTSVDTTLNQGPKVISDVDDLTLFIEHSYNYYQQIVTTYNLNNLINLGVLAKQTPYIEVKTLLMCNFLEVLRYNYALNIGCPKGDFTRDRKDNFYLVTNERRNGRRNGRRNCSASSQQRASFQEILEHFCDKNSLTGWCSSFKDIRDKIVHTGNITGSTFQEKIQKYQDLHHFCDRVILALLQWDCAGVRLTFPQCDVVSGPYIPINCPPNPESVVNRVAFTR
ncbi:hypothetical protein [Tychonema sp. BBK16]|uniref:hypothetical protein n=1 Tax=Tychonema sp. BBK16 TaxID=2699888 RepID=UPI001F32B5D6|nr:hypothetical protein [Tychonema sp. BBK16]MCF6374503.1 hypothetical protein [Tychonema sp. BBK16]